MTFSVVSNRSSIETEVKGITDSVVSSKYPSPSPPIAMFGSPTIHNRPSCFSNQCNRGLQPVVQTYLEPILLACRLICPPDVLQVGTYSIQFQQQQHANCKLVEGY